MRQRWENCEGWDFGDELLAGHLVPEFSPAPQKTVYSRLHPSVIWASSLPLLRAELAQRCKPGEDVIGPRMSAQGATLHAWLTLAPLYARIKDRCALFDERHLNAYDHLSYGSSMPLLGFFAPGLDARSDAHRAAASGDIEALRGTWRRQVEELDGRHAFGVRAPAHVAARQLAQLQGLTLDEAAAYSVVDEMRGRALRGTSGKEGATSV